MKLQKFLEKCKRNDVYDIPDWYSWQQEAIEKGIFKGSNMIISTPTGSGKSIFAEIVTHYQTFLGNKVLYLIPWIAPAEERASSIKQKNEELGFSKKVILMAGRIYEIQLKGELADKEQLDAFPYDFDVIVSTPEMFDKFVRIQPNIVKYFSTVVIDEIHLLSEVLRGATLDKLIAILLHEAKDLQVLAMSATISNGDDLARWLNAELITLDPSDRPVKLYSCVVYADPNESGKVGYLWQNDSPPLSIPDFLCIGNISSTSSQSLKIISQRIYNKIRESFNNSGQSIVFVNSRDKSVRFAMSFRKFIETSSICEYFSEDEITNIIRGFLGDKKGRDAYIQKDLRNILKYGIGYHNAKLSLLQRSVIEKLFREHHIHTLFSTSTLSLGVNLPADVVVIPELEYPQGVELTNLLATQMMGRAGRKGVRKNKGENRDAFAILLESSRFLAKKAQRRYLQSHPENIISTFMRKKSLKGFTNLEEQIDSFDSHILSLMITPSWLEDRENRSSMEIGTLVKRSFGAFSKEDEDVSRDINLAINRLYKDRFLKIIKSTSEFDKDYFMKTGEARSYINVLTEITKFGFYTIKHSIYVRIAKQIYESMKKFQNLRDISQDLSWEISDSFIKALCGIPEPGESKEKYVCIFDTSRLKRYNYAELLDYRINRNFNEMKMLRFAQVIRKDFGLRDLQNFKKQARRHLIFAIELFSSDKILRNILEDFRRSFETGLSPEYSWLLKKFGKAETAKRNRKISQIQKKIIKFADQMGIDLRGSALLKQLSDFEKAHEFFVSLKKSGMRKNYRREILDRVLECSKYRWAKEIQPMADDYKVLLEGIDY
ncbi:MAG: DEAD/DEAH box helicase [Candidatus Methanofastidiosia archaeon]|jgi:superfamily II DNA or RNA helicase